jgi:hypothetical protein
MTLEDRCFLAVVNVQIAHRKIDLNEYSQIMKFYNPEVKAFDLMLDKISETEAEIMRLENLLNDL